MGLKLCVLSFFIFVCLLSQTQKCIGLPRLFYKWRGYLAFYSYLSEYHMPYLILCVLWVCVWYSLSQCLLYPLCIELIHSVFKYPVVEPLNLFWQITKIEDYITGRMSEKCSIEMKSKTSFFVCVRALKFKQQTENLKRWFSFLEFLSSPAATTGCFNQLSPLNMAHFVKIVMTFE